MIEMGHIGQSKTSLQDLACSNDYLDPVKQQSSNETIVSYLDNFV